MRLPGSVKSLKLNSPIQRPLHRFPQFVDHPPPAAHEAAVEAVVEAAEVAAASMINPPPHPDPSRLAALPLQALKRSWRSVATVSNPTHRNFLVPADLANGVLQE